VQDSAADTDVARQVVERLTERGETVALAEACTGGLIGHLLTDVPGASQVFIGGVVAYANSVKQSLLGVTSEALLGHGAVSAETVRLMAIGVQQALRSDWGIAVSGVLGPTGGTEEKPAGTAWVAIAAPDSDVRAERFLWQSDRAGNKRHTAERALRMLAEMLSSTDAKTN
jgi:PncC family amidohydrolase